VGVRIDVDNFAIRLALNFLLTLVAGATYVFVSRVLLGLEVEWTWFIELFKGIGNSLVALVLFPLLDRLQIRD
jgi:predicted permease